MTSLLRRGMIVDVDLEPVRGSETGKTRPAVVVTNDVYNQRVPVIQVVPLSSWSEKKARIVAENACAKGETIHNMPFPVTSDMVYAAILTANTIGTMFREQAA